MSTPTEGWEMVPGITQDIIQTLIDTAYEKSAKAQSILSKAPTISFNTENQLALDIALTSLTIGKITISGNFIVALNLADITITADNPTNTGTYDPYFCFSNSDDPFSVTTDSGDTNTETSALQQWLNTKFKGQKYSLEKYLPTVVQQPGTELQALLPTLLNFVSLCDSSTSAAGEVLMPYMTTGQSAPSTDPFNDFIGDTALDISAVDGSDNFAMGMWDYFILNNLFSPLLEKKLNPSSITVSTDEPAVLTLKDASFKHGSTLTSLTIQFSNEGLAVDAKGYKSFQVDVSGEVSFTLVIEPDADNPHQLTTQITNVDASIDESELEELLAIIGAEIVGLLSLLGLIILAVVVLIVAIVAVVWIAAGGLEVLEKDLEQLIESIVNKLLDKAHIENLPNAVSISEIDYNDGMIFFGAVKLLSEVQTKTHAELA